MDSNLKEDHNISHQIQDAEKMLHNRVQNSDNERRFNRHIRNRLINRNHHHTSNEINQEEDEEQNINNRLGLFINMLGNGLGFRFINAHHHLNHHNDIENNNDVRNDNRIERNNNQLLHRNPRIQELELLLIGVIYIEIVIIIMH